MPSWTISDDGIIQTRIHVEGDELITEDVMPAQNVARFLRENERLREQGHNSRAKGRLGARIPTPLWQSWRTEWSTRYKQWGISWQTFLKSQVNSRDYSKLRTGVNQL